VRRRQDAASLVAGSAVLLITAWIAMGDSVGALEEEVFRFFNEWPDWIERPGWLVMQAGSAAAIVVAAVVVMAGWRARRLALALLLAGGLAWVAAKVIKEIVGRERPSALLADVIERPEWEGLGFVSGHAAVAFALATVASPYVRGRWTWVLWAVAVATGVMRIYTGGHLPLDVVGGAALGVAIGGGVNLLLGVPGQGPADDHVVEAAGT
jgi:membrane-associated phospholipid phosphatase